jgi:hypothetical protein
VKSLTLEHKPDLGRPALANAAASAAPPVLAQRKSTLGRAGSTAAPAIVDAGKPLEIGTRETMESGFGRDFSNIRVHDDARAHDNARSLSARAYTAGDHIVFGQGAYRPHTPAGRALIAHELAHSVQQSGVQMKADGPIPAATDANLETQADRAALAVTGGRSVSGLSHVGRRAIFRADKDVEAAPTATTPAAAGSATDLPNDVELIQETPRGPGATVLVVALPMLILPHVKGKGPWVQQAYTNVAAGNRLVFSPIFDGKTYEAATSIKAFKELPGDSYKDIWLRNYGFTSLKDLGKGIRTAAADPEVGAEVKTAIEKPEVKKVVKGFEAGTLTAAGCDIDHIVEKQIGGTSIASNLQLLVSTKNQESGRQTYAEMVALVKRILEPNRKQVKQLQIRFKDAKVPEDIEDGSYEIEVLLRAGKIKGSEAVMKKGEGTPVRLLAGGASEVVRVLATGATPIDMAERRLIPGMKLIQYRRGAGSSPTKGTDTVEAELASKPMLKGEKNITLTASIAPAPSEPEPSAGASADEKAGASEVRKLTLEATKNKDIPFYYPYLSRGRLTTLEVDASNNFRGEGVITPTVKFLGDLKVRFGPDELALVQDINVASINNSAYMRPVAHIFRFKSGSVSIDLVRFKPEGKLEMEVGPAAKPVIRADVSATEEGGYFVATGTLVPAGPIPGIKDAKGEVKYRGDTGWSGELSATSSSIPNSTANVKLGFKEAAGHFQPYGEGTLSTTVRTANLTLHVAWNGGGVNYYGAVTVEKPLPLVDRVTLKGAYIDDLLTLSGTADIKWNSIDAQMDVTYRRKATDTEGKFSGKAGVDIKQEKADGHVDLNFAEDGSYWGGGYLSYQLTKDIRPKLGLELTKDHKVRVFGEVRIADIPLTRMWPSPEGGKLTLIKGAGVKFTVPTPLSPAVNAFGEITVSAGLAYGVGPVKLTAVIFTGELYPLEPDLQIKASLRGRLIVPAYGEIYGTFGAFIGAEVAFGAVGAKGGITVTPALRIQAEAGLDVDAAYDAGFSFSAEAYVKGQLIAKLAVKLEADLYAAYGLLSATWTYEVANFQKQIGPELKLTLGKVGYAKDGTITLPDPSQISLEPKDLDPLELLKELLSEGKKTDK